MTGRIVEKPGGVRFAVRIVPRGGGDKIEGWETDAAGRDYLKLRVRAAPEDGKANAALVALLARHLRVPRSGIEIASGARARMKIVAVQGDPGELRRRLALANANSGAKI